MYDEQEVTKAVEQILGVWLDNLYEFEKNTDLDLDFFQDRAVTSTVLFSYARDWALPAYQLNVVGAQLILYIPQGAIRFCETDHDDNVIVNVDLIFGESVMMDVGTATGQAPHLSSTLKALIADEQIQIDQVTGAKS
jgi:hypothetical protein